MNHGNALNQNDVKVYFPCVRGPAKGQMVTINCFTVEELKGTVKVVSGVDEEIARRIIGASRFNERDGRIAAGVMAVFSNPYFSGESYGLSLAVGDKLARYGSARSWTEVYATGSIPGDGCGVVCPVKGFEQKIDIILETGRPGSLFIYPQDNMGNSEVIKRKVHCLREKDITALAVHMVDELDGVVWNIPTPLQRDHASSSIPPKRTQGAKLLSGPVMVIGLSSAVLAGLLWGLFFYNPGRDNVIVAAPEKKPQRIVSSAESPKANPHQDKRQIQETASAANMKAQTERKQQNVPQSEGDTEHDNQKPVLESGDIDLSQY